METILKLQNVNKTYTLAGKTLHILNDVSLEVAVGASIAIVGPSGSGKTTLLGLSAGLDRSTSGSIVLGGTELDRLDEDERAAVRNRDVGFIFQNFQLLPTLTALENVMVPMELRGEAPARTRARARELLEVVGLGERMSHYPVQLSGGEQQRVSLARAFGNRPRILFADEPTGNLDAETSEKIKELLFDLNRQAGTTLVLVTHNSELAARTQRIIRIAGGRIVSDEKR